MNNWLPPLIAFLLGSIPFGLLIAKSQGINIREHGSGNIGATNVLRTVGKKYGITCFILDFFKGFIPALLGVSFFYFGDTHHSMALGFLKPYAMHSDDQFFTQSMQVFTGLCAILGHNYSPWVNFKGGKGIATSAGVLAVLMPAGLVILIVIFILTFKLTRYVSVASMAGAASLPIIVLGGSLYHGKFQDGTWNKPLLIFAILIAFLAIWKHRSNIKNLINGSEHKFTPKKK